MISGKQIRQCIALFHNKPALKQHYKQTYYVVFGMFCLIDNFNLAKKDKTLKAVGKEVT